MFFTLSRVHGVHGVCDVACLLQQMLQELFPQYLQQVCNVLQLRKSMLQLCCREVAEGLSATSLHFLQHFQDVAGMFQGTDFLVAGNAKMLQIIRGGLLQIIEVCCRE
jgi:hypothetical protein